jgi:nucleoside-triphosphatase THEP1
LLATIVYETGFAIDDFMRSIVAALKADGMRICGAVQQNEGSRACPAMSLVDLATGKRFAISQPLGTQARGCRLDPRGLALTAAWLDAVINDDVDLLVVNKFGKAEAEGAGFRTAFVRALDAGVPVLTAARPPYLAAWRSFHGGLATDLVPSAEAVLAWCRGAVRKLPA